MRIVARLLAILFVFLYATVSQNGYAQTSSPYWLDSRKLIPKGGIPPGLNARIARAIELASPLNKRAHILLQFHSPPGTADRQRLSLLGITLLEPLNRLTWYASIVAPIATVLTKDNTIRWADMIRPSDRLSAGVGKGIAVSPDQRRPDNRLAYSVMFHKDVTAQEIAEFTIKNDFRLEGFDGKVFPTVRSVVVSIPIGSISKLFEADIVASIEPPPGPDESHEAGKAQRLSKVEKVQLAPVAPDGTDVIVGIWEARSVVHPDHLDLTPRVIVKPNQMCTRTTPRMLPALSAHPVLTYRM